MYVGRSDGDGDGKLSYKGGGGLLLVLYGIGNGLELCHLDGPFPMLHAPCSMLHDAVYVMEAMVNDVGVAHTGEGVVGWWTIHNGELQGAYKM